MKTFIIILAMALFGASVSHAAIYIKVKGDKGTVYWDKKDLSGYFKYKKKGGGVITFTNGKSAYIFQKTPDGFVYGTGGHVIDNYFIYTYNPKTGKYDYNNGKEIISID